MRPRIDAVRGGGLSKKEEEATTLSSTPRKTLGKHQNMINLSEKGKEKKNGEPEGERYQPEVWVTGGGNTRFLVGNRKEIPKAPPWRKGGEKIF